MNCESLVFIAHAGVAKNLFMRSECEREAAAAALLACPKLGSLMAASMPAAASNLHDSGSDSVRLEGRLSSGGGGDGGGGGARAAAVVAAHGRMLEAQVGREAVMCVYMHAHVCVRVLSVCQSAQ
eukprot:1157310-Pelagomonas_calceolata.AAC.5